MSYRYRCDQCRTTSPPVLTRGALADERRVHRRQFHGGHIPDGERVIEPEPFRFTDVPVGQLIVGTFMIVIVLAGIMARIL
ncbi:hypothetical protein [Streptomyces sp. NRRL B-1347]|uniref:hypothetical protein n=1 Tax=Streptomyces sp. NRRL B-1347 TaxID=1476877 RepID=UPI0004C527B3|nr:hypothetical protein [Streptomyces sp. NRRL B-1347]